MKPLGLKLRGSIGIRDGLGREEIEIDLTRLSPGLVAIVGDNGSGKTTTMGNMLAYRCLPGRDGSLANQFYLKDSYRDFHFEMAGHHYRSYIVIDGRTGKQEAYLYCEGKPLNDGKTGTYDAEVERLLGSEDIFFKSVFASQKAKTITSLTAGKRKELFMELLGFQRYELYAQHCKAQGDGLETDVATKRGRLEQINESVAKRPIVTAELDKIQLDLQAIEQELKDVQAQVNAGTAELSERESRLAENKLRALQVHDLGNEISVIEARKWKLGKDYEAEVSKAKAQRQALEVEIGRKKQIVEHKHEIEENVIRLQTLRLEHKSLTELREELLAVEREEEKTREEYQTALSSYRLALSQNANEKTSLENEKKHLLIEFEASAQNAEERLIRARKTASLIDEVPCKGYSGLPETCQLLTTAIAAKTSIAELEENVRALRDPVLLQEHGLADLEARISANDAHARELVEPTNHVAEGFAERKRAIGYDPARFMTLGKEIAGLEAKKWETLLEELRVSEATIEEKQKALGEIAARAIDQSNKHHAELQELDAQVVEKRSKWEELKGLLLPDDFHAKHEQLKSALAAVQHELKDLADRRSEVLGDIQFHQEMLKQLEKSAAEGEVIRGELKTNLSRLENWRLLQRACSKDGIPALELDAAGPAVSQIANDLLASTFGTRFQISFETTRQSKDGKKQIEDFDIWVYGDFGRKRIEDLSGGEEVWIEAAIRQAIASYLRKQTGRDLACRWLDEADGPLSGAKAQNYLDMIRISHERERYYFTFIVSHRQELVAQIQQQIRFLPEESRVEIV